MKKPFEYIRSQYKVPAEIGRIVLVEGEKGIIIADRGNYIGVNFDKDKPQVITNCHPTWKVEYLGVGVVRKLTKSQQRYQRFLEVGDCFDSFHHFLKYEEAERKASYT